MVVAISFTKKVKTVNCKNLVITYILLVNFLITFTNEPLKLPVNQLVKITIYL